MAVLVADRRGGAGRRGRGAGVDLVVAELVLAMVAELGVLVREALATVG